VTTKDFQPHLRDEAIRVWELHQAGLLRELYFRQDEDSAVLMLECTDTNEAEEILNTLPLVKEGLISFDIIPLVPYPGFSRLFEAQ
jgi:muconolactone delta-isomerase